MQHLLDPVVQLVGRAPPHMYFSVGKLYVSCTRNRRFSHRQPV